MVNPLHLSCAISFHPPQPPPLFFFFNPPIWPLSKQPPLFFMRRGGDLKGDADLGKKRDFFFVWNRAGGGVGANKKPGGGGRPGCWDLSLFWNSAWTSEPAMARGEQTDFALAQICFGNAKHAPPPFFRGGGGGGPGTHS